jgi:hypothetical protein
MVEVTELSLRPLRPEPGPATRRAAAHAERESGSVWPGAPFRAVIVRQLVRQPAWLAQAPQIGL